MEDPAKIKAKIEELSNATGHKWTSLSGNHAVTKVDIHEGDNYTFRPDSGMPLKVFVDLETGEVKSFVSFVFEVDRK